MLGNHSDPEIPPIIPHNKEEAPTNFFSAVSSDQFRAIVDEHTPRLHNLLKRDVPHVSEREEIINQAFARLANSSAKAPDNIAFFINRIARNLVIDTARRKTSGMRKITVNESAYGNGSSCLASLSISSENDPALICERRDQLSLGKEMISDALAGLTDIEKECLVLIDIEELSEKEIAQRLDIPVGTVKSRTNRARRRLKEIIHAHPKAESYRGLA